MVYDGVEFEDNIIILVRESGDDIGRLYTFVFDEWMNKWMNEWMNEWMN